MLSSVLILVGLQQKDDSRYATIVITLRGNENTFFDVIVPYGFDVVNSFASTGLLIDDSNPPGTPPKHIHWTGTVNETALVWIKFYALPYARPGLHEVTIITNGGYQDGDYIVKYIRVPKPTLYRLWFPFISHKIGQ